MSDRVRAFVSALPLLVVRMAVAVLCVLEGGVFGVVYAAGEFLFIGGAVVNVIQCKKADRRRVAWFVPLIYGLAFVVVPVGQVSGWGVLAFVVVTVFRFWCQLVLRSSFSTGVPTWVKLRERGPYALVRHPMTAGSVAWRLIVIACWPHWWNVTGGVLYVGLLVSEVLVEEGFLRRVEDWEAYSLRVRWRLCPYVW